MSPRYEQGIKLTGLLFLHRISDNRMSGTLQRNTQIFEMVCGPGALQNVILVTTMWNTVNIVTGSMREKELRTDFWKSMISSGSQIARFDYTYQSAWKILNKFTGDPRSLLLQREMVEERKTLAQTTAGTAHFQWLQQLVTQFLDIFATLRRLFPGLPKRSGTGGEQQQGMAEGSTADTDAKSPVINEPIDEKASYGVGEIPLAIKDPWLHFAYPDTSRYDTVLVELARSARRSFEIIELRQKQRRLVCCLISGKSGNCSSFQIIYRSGQPLVEEIVDQIAKQGPNYYKAIQKSAKTAQRGCLFAMDAIDFCGRLLKGGDSFEKLKSGLGNIKDVAKNAHQDALEMNQQFKDVRVELFKVRFMLVTPSTFNKLSTLLDLERHTPWCNQYVGFPSLHRSSDICSAASQVARWIKMSWHNSKRRAMIWVT